MFVNFDIFITFLRYLVDTMIKQQEEHEKLNPSKTGDNPTNEDIVKLADKITVLESNEDITEKPKRKCCMG